MRASRFVVGLAGLILCASVTAEGQYQPEPAALSSSARTAVTTATVVSTAPVSAVEVAVADATVRTTLDPRTFTDPRVQSDGMGRLGYILIGAVVGGAAVYGLGLAAKGISDCECSGRSLGIAAAGGAVVGGFIGSVAFGMRNDQSRPAAAPGATDR